MRFLSFVAFLIVFPFIVGCNSKKSDDMFLCNVRSYDIKDVSTIELSGRLLPVEILGASEIAVCDSMLVVITSNKNAFFSVVGLNSCRTLAEFGTEGQSRIEFFYPSIEDVFKHESGNWLMEVRDGRDGSSKFVDLTESVNQGKTVIDNVVEMGNSYDHKEYDLPDGRKLVYYSYGIDVSVRPPRINILKDSVETVIPVYADRNISYEDRDFMKSVVCWSCMVVHDKKMSHFGMVNPINSVVFLDVDSQNVFYLNDGSISEDYIEFLVTGGDEENLPDMAICCDALATDKYVFVLATPVMRSNEDDSPKSEVRIFDWNGNAIGIVNLDQIISCFSYDEHTGLLYGLDNVMETFYVYDLNTIID